MRKTKTKKRILRLVLVLFAILILLVLFLVPAFVSSEKGRKIILAKINRSIDGEADFSSLSMSWWKGVKVKNFSFNGSAEEILVRIKQIVTKPYYGSILMGDLSFGKTKIFEPKVEINLERWRSAKAREIPEKEKRRPVTLPIKKIDMKVTDGSLKVTDAKAKTVELSQIQSKVNLRPLGRRTSFNINAAVAGEGKKSKISAEGRVTPKKKTGWSFKGTSGDFTVEVNDLDLGSLGPLLALGGIDIQAEGKVSANLISEIKDGRIEDLSGTIKGEDLDITGGQLKGDRFKTNVLDVDVKLRREKEVINVDKLEVHSDWLDAEAGGVVPKTFKSLSEFVKPDSAYSLSGTFACDLAQALSQMPRTFHVKKGMNVTSGRLSGDITTSAKAGRKQINGRGTLTGLAGVVDGRRIALSQPVKATVQITSDKAGIKYDKVDVSAAFCDISCAGTNKLLRYSADVDLAKLQSELGQFTDIGKYQMAGKLFSKGEVSGSKDKITAVGSSVVKDLRLISAEGKPFKQEQVSVVFDAEINPAEKSIAVKELELISPQIKIRKGNFIETTEKGTTKLKGQVDCEYDLSAVSTIAAPFLPEGLKFKGERKQTIEFSSEYPAGKRAELLANLSTEGKLGFDSAYYKGLTFSPTETEIRIVKGLFTISQFSSKVNNGVFRFVGQADFKQKPALLMTLGPIRIAEGVQLNDDVSRELLVYLNPIFADAFNVSGVGNLNCERLALPLREVDKKETEIIGTIWADNINMRLSEVSLLGRLLSFSGLGLRDQNIKVHPTKFALQSGFIRYDDMRVDVGDNPVNFKGVIGLDKSLNMIVTLPYTLDGRTVRVGEEEAGKRISIPLTGTIYHPDLDVGKLLELQLKQQLEEQIMEKIFEGIEELLK